MKTSENPSEEDPSLEKTQERAPLSQEEASKLPEKTDPEDATLIRDADETSLGDVQNMEMLRLGIKAVILSRKDSGKEFFMTSNEVIVGRGTDCDWVMDYPGVSRRHLKIHYQNQKLFVEDLGSKFGTLLGKKKISGSSPLKSGQWLQLGEVTLRFQIGLRDSNTTFKKPLFFVGGFVGLVLLASLVFKLNRPPSSPPPSSPPPIPPAHSKPVSQLPSLSKSDSSQTPEGFSKDASKDKEALLGKNLKETKRFFEAGLLDAADTQVEKILSVSPENKRALKLKHDIVSARKEKKANRLLQEKRLLKEKQELEKAKTERQKLLKEIQDLEQTKRTQKKHSEHSSSILLAHALYQKALGKMAAGNLKQSLKDLTQLEQDFPDQEIFQETKEELEARLDNLGKSLFRAGYIIEPHDPLKAKRIWRRLFALLPKQHPYAQKAKAKLR